MQAMKNMFNTIITILFILKNYYMFTIEEHQISCSAQVSPERLMLMVNTKYCYGGYISFVYIFQLEYTKSWILRMS